MKKSLIALLALSSVAMAGNVVVIDSLTIEGNEHQDDRLDFHFNDSANRTVTLKTTANASVASTNGYGLSNASNVLNLDITGTFTITGEFKGVGNGNGSVNITTTLSSEELTSLFKGTEVSRDVVSNGMDGFLNNLNPSKLTLSIGNLPDGVSFGGLLAKVSTGSGITYYNAGDVNFSNGYWSIKTGASAVELAANTAYGYTTVTAPNGAAPRMVGFVANYTAPVPEPATGSLSLLALAGLCARRRKK